MAIYHFSAQVISRGKGQSAIASAAYRSGERLQDERTGETKYYKRQVQPETMILSPIMRRNGSRTGNVFGMKWKHLKRELIPV